LKQDPLKKLKRKKGLQSKEYDNLRQLLPSLAYVKDVSKVSICFTIIWTAVNHSPILIKSSGSRYQVINKDGYLISLSPQ
jgi:hypothetical protein